MRIAYFSPFSPDKSGVSDFSEELVLELCKYVDIELFSRTAIKNPKIVEKFTVHSFEEIEDDSFRNNFDFLVYQIGNNITYHKGVTDCFLKYPDILEIHDLSLHHYLAEDTFVKQDYDKYVEIMKYCHGKDGEKTAKRFLSGQIRAPWETDSAKYTVNKHLIDRARAIIVHSDMAKQYVRGIRLDVPIINIPLQAPDIIENFEVYKKECKRELHFSDDTIVFGSFGYATLAKRIEPILNALSIFKKSTNYKFVYCIVGKVENIDVPELLSKLDLKENVIVTGFAELDEFKRYMGACDICFNLRYPTQGESSASLHRMLGMGKPILVTNIGAFEEYPDDIVMKVRYDENEVQDIYANIMRLLENPNELVHKSKKAFEYANENCNLTKNAKRYYKFFEEIQNGTYSDNYIDEYLNILQELDLMLPEVIEKSTEYMAILDGK